VEEVVRWLMAAIPAVVVVTTQIYMRIARNRKQLEHEHDTAQAGGDFEVSTRNEYYSGVRND
jgi:hypothetical protein